MSEIHDRLANTFTPDIKEILVSVINQAYEENINLYTPEIGHDAMVFGIMMYKSKTFYLAQAAEETKAFTVIKTHPYFSLQIGNYRVSTYCAGHSSESGIANSFPKNHCRVPKMVRMNQAQMILPFAEIEDDQNYLECDHLIISDIGNPRDGLQKIFIGIPIQVSRKRLSKWGPQLEIWSADNLVQDHVFIKSQAIAPAEQITPPTLTLKENKNISEME